MRDTINIPPPADFSSFSPSELFKFYFQIGRWTEESFSDALQAFTRGKLVSTVTISNWKNKNVIPTRYSGAFLNMIESSTEPNLAASWSSAFETVWALHSAGRTQNKPPTDMTSRADTVCEKHREWITKLYFGKQVGDGFSLAELYVPLQLHNIETDDIDILDLENLINPLNTTDKETNENDWVFISGGPGAGKSMTALHLAHILCEEDIYPVYLRGSQLSNIDLDIIDPAQPIGDSFSAKSFIQNFRASSFDTACLIIDGLDEIHREPNGAVHVLTQFIKDLKNQQKACAAHNKNLTIIALGRESHIQICADQIFPTPCRRLSLCALDGSLSSERNASTSIYGQDLRSLWWMKYLAAKGYDNDPSLPDFLITEYDDFAEFGTDPLLSFLICDVALQDHDNSELEVLPHECVNALTYGANKNIIYERIIDHQAQNVRHLLDSQPFLYVLQHIALTAWHNGEDKTVSLEALYESVKGSHVEKSLQALTLFDSTAHRPSILLLTDFYVRLPRDGQTPQSGVIEFTHKSIAEYLVSTLLFDKFTALVKAFGKMNEFEAALKDWSHISIKGAHGPSLADFCQNEAALRFDTLSDMEWDVALDIIKNYIPGHAHESEGIALLSDIQRSSNLLFFIWSCLNLERQKRTGDRFHLPNEGPRFNTLDLKTLTITNGLNFKSGSLNEPTLRDVTFLTQSLSGLHLKYADMSQLSLSLGHLENLLCEDTSFAMTHWSHVKATASRFKKTKFQQVIFHHWRVMESQFNHCLIQGSRFQGGGFWQCQIEETFFSQCHFSDVEFIASHFKNVIFDRCVFSQSVFSFDKDLEAPLAVKFHHCTFMDMDTPLKTLPTKNTSHAMSEYGTVEMKDSGQKQNIKTAFDDLL